MFRRYFISAGIIEKIIDDKRIENGSIKNSLTMQGFCLKNHRTTLIMFRFFLISLDVQSMISSSNLIPFHVRLSKALQLTIRVLRLRNSTIDMNTRNHNH